MTSFIPRKMGFKQSERKPERAKKLPRSGGNKNGAMGPYGPGERVCGAGLRLRQDNRYTYRLTCFVFKLKLSAMGLDHESEFE